MLLASVVGRFARAGCRGYGDTHIRSRLLLTRSHSQPTRVSIHQDNADYVTDSVVRDLRVLREKPRAPQVCFRVPKGLFLARLILSVWWFHFSFLHACARRIVFFS